MVRYETHPWSGSITFGPCNTTSTRSIPMPEKKPYKCPVCEGSGAVHISLYHKGTVEKLPLENERESCRTCDGKGIVWSE